METTTKEKALERYYAKMRSLQRDGTRSERVNALFLRIKARLPELEEIAEEMEVVEENGVYRFYHGSFKVFHLQGPVRKAFDLIKEIGGEDDSPLYDYVAIVEAGAFHKFSRTTNDNWDAETRPILEAFWHTKYFVRMMVEYATKLDRIELAGMDYGLAAVLYLFQLR
jgi:hypothetical protein